MVGLALHTKLDLIRKLGNLAVHSSKPIRVEDAIVAVRELFHFCYWLGRNYGLKATDKPATNAIFNPDQLPKTSPVTIQTIAQLQAQAQQLAAKDAQFLVRSQALSGDRTAGRRPRSTRGCFTSRSTTSAVQPAVMTASKPFTVENGVKAKA